jgi:signal peptidase I
MDQFKEYIGAILKDVSLNKMARQKLEEEFYDHLNLLKTEYKKDGYTEEQAQLLAMERFGEIEDINKSLKKVNTPYKKWKESFNQKKILKEALQWTAVFFISLIVSMSIKSYAFAQAEVKQCSMQNTLYEGQRLIESKIEYYYSEPKRGDIVIINSELEKGLIKVFLGCTREFVESFYKNQEEENKRIIKRVIGVPGDEINIKDGKVYINGELYKESYVKGETYPNSMEFPITIPDNEYFVMGDNRENSMDSRDIGLISIDKIEGKAVIRLWPLDKFGGIGK